MEKRLNKYIFTFVGALVFGMWGVDRFMRGQFGLGIIKLVSFGGFFLWYFIDLLIALSKVAEHDKHYYTFNDGMWA